MTEKTKSLIAFVFMLAAMILFAVWSAQPVESEATFTFRTNPPKAPKITYSESHNAPLEVAKVFGRASGCQDADPELIEDVARLSRRAGLDPKIAAALIAVESGCNPLAISNRGAVGLTQVRPIVWKDKYDFSRTNLLNSGENMQVGFEILAELIQQYGTYEGVRRYQGLGIGCETCDGQYTEKIFRLAGKK